MSEESIQNIEAADVQTVTVTENHVGGKVADQEHLRRAELEQGVLTLWVGEDPPFGYIPPEECPLEGVNLEDIAHIKVVNHTTGTETQPQWLIGVDPLDGSHLHIFTDKSL